MNRKKARLWFLVSRRNLEYLNELERCNNSPKYTPLISQNYIPPFIQKTRHFLRLYCFCISFIFCFRLICEFISALIEKVSVGNVSVNEKKGYLLTSSALPRILDLANLKAEDGFWLKAHGKIDEAINQVKVVSAVSIIDVRCIIWSMVDVIVSYFYILHKKGFSYVLEVKGGFDWFLCYWALQKLETDIELFFCNQIDHWTPLIDKSPQKVKIHLQHGTMYSLRNWSIVGEPFYTYIDELKAWTVNIPYKMHNIKTAYAFSKKEYIAECMSFLYGKQHPVIMGYPLRMGDLTSINATKKSVLIIAYFYKYGAIEEQLISALQKMDFEIYLKNHPTVPIDKYSHLKTLYSFNLINGPVFPKTDIVLSYDSTLAKEYESLGIKVLYFDDISVDEVVKEVKSLS